MTRNNMRRFCLTIAVLCSIMLVGCGSDTYRIPPEVIAEATKVCEDNNGVKLFIVEEGLWGHTGITGRQFDDLSADVINNVQCNDGAYFTRKNTKLRYPTKAK